MTDEREYWRSVVVGRANEQQPIYAGELLDELADLRAQLAEANERIEALEEMRRFYANKSNWYKQNPSRDPYATVRYPSKAEQDSGERAREVLT